MDFSSSERALESLIRRQPPLDDSIQEIAASLLKTPMNDEAFPSLTMKLFDSNNQNKETIRWEPLAVGLHLTASYLLQVTLHFQNDEKASLQVYQEGPRVPQDSSFQNKIDIAIQDMDQNSLIEFCAFMIQQCQLHLEHKEPRVRSLVAKVVGQHAKLAIGTHTTVSTASMSQELLQQSLRLYQKIEISFYHHISSGPETQGKSKASSGALDDTTGWRALETNLYGIGSFIQATSYNYFKYQDNLQKLLKAIQECCIVHVNRHVRAAGINVLEQMIHAIVNSSGEFFHMLLDLESNLRNVIVQVLKVTLADNWSQVRMAASVLCRVFYTAMMEYQESKSVDNEDWLTATFPLLLPRMCLNRFYLAQGVKLYSHETWRILFDRKQSEQHTGLMYVAKHAGAIARYYCKMADADNHVVREAACQAIAELANKIGRSEEYAEYLAPYVVMLLQALIMCFHDESWPVRDEACLACGTFCLAYPQECEPELNTLFSRWTEQLTDQIWSVREDAAVALGDAIEAYGPSMLDKVMTVLKRDLPSAKKQPAMSREEHKRRQNDIDSHTNSQLYSCGSLAPKLRKGGAGRIGCSDCLITREKAPWEATDGCIYLIRELCCRLCSADTKPELLLSDETLLPIMTELVDACRVKHFPQSDDLRTTLWKNLPLMAKALGKQRFKRNYLQMFLEMLMDNLDEKSHATQLSVHAAGQCAEELANLVGRGIFKGRLEDEWQQETFERVMRERSQMVKTVPAEGFSPFGPAEATLAFNPNEVSAVPRPAAFPASAGVPSQPVSTGGFGMTESF